MKTQTLFLIALIALTGCASSREATEAYQNRKVKFGVEAGANKGGIVDNTDLSKIEGTPVDGYTGATRVGFHAGGHAIIPVGRNDVQAGINYLFSPQTFTYNDAVHGYFGTRKISLSQLIVPVTYNVNLFKQRLDPGTISLKFGGALEYNMPSVRQQGQRLPGYTINKFSGGVTLGISALPFTFADQARLGLSFDIYRGTQIFDDLYNRAEYETPASSYMKLSVTYQFK
jgi:hypothetical protein